jgi:hypothetical protein
MIPGNEHPHDQEHQKFGPKGLRQINVAGFFAG